MDKKTVVVLGASFGQMELIKESRKSGHYIIVVTPKGNYPGLGFADEVIYEDIRNVCSIYEKIKEKNVEAILHDQLDIAVLSAAQLSSMLGIRGITVEIAKRFTDKSLMKEFAKKCGISVPKNIVVDCLSKVKDNIEYLEYPMIMKPLDSSASHGVFRVENIDDINDNFEETRNYSATGKVIIEEYIDGQEYVVEAFTRAFKTYNLVVGERSYFNISNTFIPNMTLFIDAESASGNIEKRLKKANIELIAAMGLEFGMTHAEFIYDYDKDKIFLIEIAARGGGVCTSTKIVPAACGVNLTKLYIDELLCVFPKEIQIRSGNAAYICFILPEGRIVNISNWDKIDSIDGVIYSQFRLSLNDITPPIEDKYARQGPIIVRGNNKHEIISAWEIIKATLKITVETNNGLKDIIWE